MIKYHLETVRVIPLTALPGLVFSINSVSASPAGGDGDEGEILRRKKPVQVNNTCTHYKSPNRNGRHFTPRCFHLDTSALRGARCSSVVRPCAQGAMGRLIDPSWG